MKKCLLFLSFLLMSIVINAQSDFKEEVIETTLNKNAMWINLKKWVSSNFNSYKYVVDLEDEDNGVLIVKYKSSVSCLSKILDISMESTLQIDVRNNKYRIRISDEYIKMDSNDVDVDNLTSGMREKYIGDLKVILEIIKSDKITIENLMPIVQKQKDVLDNTQKYKNEKAEKKGKVTKEYERKERNLLILTDMLENSVTISESVLNSLKKQMIYVDDF